ncbi:hypothetical protein OpiT1DRAFT_02383 [Opitutaceae bacterium TAV1]|nr:hypothetical protein OpiT1DRAFT_02383 [Opitutaceae bacterium TAV1]
MLTCRPRRSYEAGPVFSQRTMSATVHPAHFTRHRNRTPGEALAN